MRVYRVDWEDSGNGCCITWHITKRSALKEKADLERDGTQVYSLEAVDIPTNKLALVGWLNTNFNMEV